MTKPKILLVEDEKPIADAVVYALSTEGFEVTWSQRVFEALKAFDAGNFSLVVMDVGLPDGNGFDLCKKLRSKSRVPIIFLTARSEETDKVVGLEIGADDFVPKPFSPRELAARVKAVLRRSSGLGSDGSPANTPIVIHEEKLSVSYFGKPVALTRYEFRILKILCARPGWVFSREQLLEGAWDNPLESDDRTVDAHIKSLRAKLREVRSDIDPIKTHRGSGYSLKEDW